MRFVIREKVREFFRMNRMRVGNEVYEAVDGEIERILTKAVERAKGNRSGTVMKVDI